MDKSRIVFLNGKFIPEEKAQVSVLAPGFLYGWGLFESMRSYNNKIVYFQHHLKRIKNSCKLMDMKFIYGIDKSKEIIQRAVKINGLFDAYVRLTLWKSKSNTGILIAAKNYRPPSLRKYRRGFRASVAIFRQNENSFFSRLKTANYLLSQLSYSQARRGGFDEAIILNNRGYITEGSRTNIFFAKNNAIFTPGLECGCLDGITRRVVFDLAKQYNIKIYEGNFTLLDLYGADEAFLTNSLIGIMPLASIARRQIASGSDRGKLTKFFMERYKCLLK